MNNEKLPTLNFNKILIRNMRRRFSSKLSHVSDEDIVKRHRYITNSLNTSLSRSPDLMKYMTGWKLTPQESLKRRKEKDQQ